MRCDTLICSSFNNYFVLFMAMHIERDTPKSKSQRFTIYTKHLLCVRYARKFSMSHNIRFYDGKVSRKFGFAFVHTLQPHNNITVEIHKKYKQIGTYIQMSFGWYAQNVIESNTKSNIKCWAMSLYGCVYTRRQYLFYYIFGQMQSFPVSQFDRKLYGL